MSSPEDRAKKQRRLKNKRSKDRVRSPIAKELITSGAFSQRIVKDKRGKKHDLDKLTFTDLVQEIQDD